jgi:sec-independent protein translocase protein TatC
MNSDDRDSRGERESTSDASSGTSEPETPSSSDSPDNGGESAAGRRDKTIGPAEGGESTEHPAETPVSEPPVSEPPAPYYDDPYAEGAGGKELVTTDPAARVAPLAPPPPPPPPSPVDELDDEEGGMSRMSFLEHLEELRTRLIRSLGGLVLAYMACLVFAQQLFLMIKDPFDQAIKTLPKELDARMVQSTAMEGFQLMYIKIPLLAAVFVAAPWLMYQAWGFVAPGLYKRERRWAAPFILSTAALFILGGVFGYFVALQFALAFLVGMSLEMGISAYVGVSSYFDNFVAIMLGLGLVFQMPIVIFFLTLIRLVTPSFLLNNVRYAILIIFVLAAAITPTPDVFNMIVFAGPMILLFYVGIFASYILVLTREGRRMPAKVWALLLLVLLAIGAGVVYYLHVVLGFPFTDQFPWMARPQ